MTAFGHPFGRGARQLCAVALCQLALGCGARASLDAPTGAGGAASTPGAGAGTAAGGQGGAGGVGQGGVGQGGDPNPPCGLEPASAPLVLYPDTLFGLSPNIIARDDEVLLHVRSGGAQRVGVLVREAGTFFPALDLQTVNDATALGAALAWTSPSTVAALFGDSSSTLMLQGLGFDGSFDPPLPLPLDVGPGLFGAVELVVAKTPSAELFATYNALVAAGNGPTLEPSAALLTADGVLAHGPVPLETVSPPGSFELETSARWVGDRGLVAVSHGACAIDGCTSTVTVRRIVPVGGGGLAASLAWSAELVGRVRAALATWDGRIWLALLDEEASQAPLSLVELDQDGFALGEIATPDLGPVDVGGTWAFADSLAGLTLTATSWGLVASWMSITDIPPPSGASQVADLHLVHVDHDRQQLAPAQTLRILDPTQQSPPRVDATDSPASLVMVWGARGMFDDAPLDGSDAGRTYVADFRCQP